LERGLEEELDGSDDVGMGAPTTTAPPPLLRCQGDAVL
jgi:hypothetical protein